MKLLEWRQFKQSIIHLIHASYFARETLFVWREIAYIKSL